MKNTLAADFGVEYPIFAFSHCRDVVAEVSRRGGFGVYGGASHTLDELKVDLAWIDEHSGGKPYGVDLLLPTKKVDSGAKDPDQLRQDLIDAIPQEHRRFARQIFQENGLATRPLDAPFLYTGNLFFTDLELEPMIDAILEHPLCKFFVSALGTPPREVIDRFHEHGVTVGALAGTVRHAEKHVQGGVDVIIAQGTEAGGHTGDIASMVLTPDVVDVAQGRPVITAGGIGSGRQIAAALALGAQGVWQGSVWLTVVEAETTEAEREEMIAASSSDTVRSKSMTGKSIRQLRSIWTDAWSRPDAPEALTTPLQIMLVEDALGTGHKNPAGGMARSVVGQVVGRMNEVRSVRTVLDEQVTELITTLEGMTKFLDD